MKKISFSHVFMCVLIMSTSFFFSCEKEDTTLENKEENPIDMYPDSVSTMLFSCKIDGTVF